MTIFFSKLSENLDLQIFTKSKFRNKHLGADMALIGIAIRASKFDCSKYLKFLRQHGFFYDFKSFQNRYKMELHNPIAAGCCQRSFPAIENAKFYS